MQEHNESELVSKGPCDECGSSDANCYYTDGHHYCFSCGHFTPPEGEQEDAPKATKKAPADLINYEIKALKARGVSRETAALFDYGVGKFKGEPVQVANYKDLHGNPVGQKLRFRDKEEGMPFLGSQKKAALFGAWRAGKSKRLVITEGELDAMSMSQMMGNSWPVVSLKRGADGATKDIAEALDWLMGFDEICLCFDMDEPGRNAAVAAAEVLVGRTVTIAHLPLKDANEMLLAGRTKEAVHAVFNAKPYTPESVVSGEDIWTRLRNRPKVVSHPFPDYMTEMNKKALGIRLGELETWTSGSGMGKTTMIKQLQAHYRRTTPYNQAIIHLEEPLEDTAESLLGVWMEKRMDLPEVADTVTDEELRAAFEEMFLAKDNKGNERIYLHDAFGSMGSDENLMNRIRYYAIAHDCKIIWLDHLSILVSDMGEQGDERRRIDALMHNLKNLTVELGIYIGLISHLKKAGGSGPSFEEGAVPSLDDLRGSGSIKQLSNSVFALSRNQQAESEVERNTTQCHVLKCRKTGDTGPADFLSFDRLTGTFKEGCDPAIAAEFGPAEDDEFEDDIPF